MFAITHHTTAADAHMRYTNNKYASSAPSSQPAKQAHRSTV